MKKIPSLLFLFSLFLSSPALVPQERFRKSAPPPDPLQELKLPETESATLSNGLVVSVLPQNKIPVMDLRLIIMTGENSSPVTFPGLATFTARMVNKGTLNLSSSELEETIESIGGNLKIDVSQDYTLFSFSFLEDYLDKALELMAEMLIRPTFPRIEIENVKRTMYYDLIGMYSDPDFLAKRLLLQILFKGHAYHNLFYGDDVIKNFNRKELLSFFDNYYRPNNTKLILAGNLSISTAARKVSHFLGPWQKKQVEPLLTQPPQPNDRQKICFINLAGAEDATIYLGNLISPFPREDYFPFLVLNQVLGGTPSSRLFMNLRESKGYAYWAFSFLDFFRTCTVFWVKTRVRSEKIYDSVAEMLNEIQMVIKEKIPHSEIEQAKSCLIGNFPLKMENFENLSNKIAEIQAFNLGEERWKKYYENLMMITPERVFESAQKSPLLSPVVVIIGDIKNLAAHLAGFEEVEVYDTKAMFLFIWKGEER